MLCVLTLGLWMRSYHSSEYVEYVHDHRIEPGRRLVFLSSDRGRVAFATGILDWHNNLYSGGFEFWHAKPKTSRPPTYWNETEGNPDDPSPPPTPPWWARIGFGIQHIYLNDCSDDQITIAAPHWFIGLLTLLIPAIWLMGTSPKHRRPKELCNSCGYDLRATPDRCPECGTVPAGKTNISN